MKRAESRQRKRRRSFLYFSAGLGILGFFLIVGGLWPRDSAWIFTVAGFVGFFLFTRQALAPWNLDRLVFDRQAFGGRVRATRLGLEAWTVRPGKPPAELRGPRVLPWQPKTTLSADRRVVERRKSTRIR